MTTHTTTSSPLTLLGGSSSEEVRQGLEATLFPEAEELRSRLLEGLALSSSGQIQISAGLLKETVPKTHQAWVALALLTHTGQLAECSSLLLQDCSSLEPLRALKNESLQALKLSRCLMKTPRAPHH